MNAMKEKQVYEAIPEDSVPAGSRVLRSMFVFRRKYHNGEVSDWKARLVCLGQHQRPGIDVDETSAPTVAMSSLRLAFALSVNNFKYVEHLDCKSAYLQCKLEKVVYMRPPPMPDGSTNGVVWALQRAVYGMKDSGYFFGKKCEEAMRALGMMQSDVDPRFFYKNQGTNELIIVCVFVDDFVILTNCKSTLDWFNNDIRRHLEVGKAGPAEVVLGLEVQRSHDGSSVTITLRNYIETLLKKYGLENCKPANAPTASTTALYPEPHDINATAKPTNRIKFLELTGALNYLAQSCRPDLARAVSDLCRFMQNPQEHHFQAGIHILRYLRGTSQLGLTYRRPEDPTLANVIVYHADASFAPFVMGNDANAKSVTGYVGIVHGAAVCWKSAVQTTVAQSSSEAEIIAINHCARDCVNTREILENLQFPQHATTLLFNDNQGAVKWTQQAMISHKGRQVRIAHHAMRELIEAGIINTQYLPTNQMFADQLTKPLPPYRLREARAWILGEAESKMKGKA